MELFRGYIEQGQWQQLDQLVQELELVDITKKVSEINKEFKFLIGKQKYLEFLEKEDVRSALLILQKELTPLSTNKKDLYNLSQYFKLIRLLVCSNTMELCEVSEKYKLNGNSRIDLLQKLSSNEI